MKYIKKNLEALLKDNTDLIHHFISRYQQLEKIEGVEFVKSVRGLPVARYKNLFIHSKYDPIREAEKIITTNINRNATNNITMALFYGFGLGYLVEKFAELFPRIPILVAEPDIDFFLMALDARDLSKLLQAGSIRFALGNEPGEFLKILETMPTHNIIYFKYRPIYQKNEKYFQKIDELIQSFFRQKEINKNTLKRFGKLWTKNILKNLRHFIKYPGISCISNYFKNIPSIVIAAGPTLDEIMPYMNEIRQRALLIAVDTSLYPLSLEGIEPDFVVVVDPQYLNTRYLEWITFKNFFFIAEPAIHPRSFKFLPAKGFFTGSFFPLGKYFEEILGEKGSLGAGGSVSTTAWDFSRYIGNNPIFLAGLDLGFPDKKLHCKGTFLDKMLLAESFKYTPFSQYIFSMTISASPYNEQSYNGQCILTDHRMAVYKHWFESQMSIPQKQKTFNLSPRSLKIRGITYEDIQKLLTFPETRTRIDNLKKEIGKFFKEENMVEKTQKLKKGINSLKDSLRQIGYFANHGLMLSTKLKEAISSGQNISNLLSELEKTDKKILQIQSKDIVGFLIHEIIKEIIEKGSNTNDKQEIVKNSISLYRELAKSSHYHLELLEHFSHNI